MRSAASAADVISQITEMVRRRDELVEQQEDLTRQIEEIDLVFSRVTGAVGIPPAGAPKFRRPKVAAAPAPSGAKLGRPNHPREYFQAIVDARAANESVEAIGKLLSLAPKTVYAHIARAKKLGITARQAGGKPSTKAPANDSDEEPEPAAAVQVVTRSAGGVQANGNGYRWKIERNFRRYLGPTVDTEEEAEQGRVETIAALDRGDLPATAPKYRSKAQREAARAARPLESMPPVKQIGVCQPEVDLSTESAGGASIEEPKEERPDDDAFADLVPVPLADLPALVAGPPRTAPGVPTWILDRLLPAWWTAYQGIVIEKVHPDVVAYLNDTTAQEVSRKAKAAEIQIERLRAWEAGRAEDGVPLTDEDKAGNALAAPDPLLAALGIKQEPKTVGDAKRAAVAAMSGHFHRLAPRQLQFAELYVAGKTNAEIAAEMGIRLPTVDNLLASTRARLEGCGRDTPPVEIDRPALPSIASVHGTMIKRAEKFRGFAAHFDELPPDQRAVVDLVIQGFSTAVIARNTDNSDAHVTELANSALGRLQLAANPPGIIEQRKVIPLQPGRTRAATIAPKRLTRVERANAELLVYPTGVERPVTRGDCETTPGEPCAWVSCSHHLYLDVNEDTGAIKLNFPHLEVWEMAETCSLDVADRGGITLEETGAILNITRERVRQMEMLGLERMKKRGASEFELPGERRGSALAEAIGAD